MIPSDGGREKKKKENSRCGCCRAGTWQRAVFISEGFAETALEWLGFLLFFHPQSDSPLLFISSYSCPSFHRAPPPLPPSCPPPLPFQFSLTKEAHMHQEENASVFHSYSDFLRGFSKYSVFRAGFVAGIFQKLRASKRGRELKPRGGEQMSPATLAA